MSNHNIADMIGVIEGIDGVRQVNNCNHFHYTKLSVSDQSKSCLASLHDKGHIEISPDGETIIINPSYHKYTVKLKAAYKIFLEV